MIYKWKAKSMVNANPKKVGVELEDLRQAKKGYIQPADIVDRAARNKNSELHKCFEWDDKKAADKFRIEQAGCIIRAIVKVVEVENEKIEIRCFESVQMERDGDDAEKFYYVSTTEALNDSDMKKQVVDDILDTIIEAKNKLDTYKMFISGKRKAESLLNQAHDSIKPRR